MTALPTIERNLNDPQRFGSAGGLRGNKGQPFAVTLLGGHIQEMLNALEDAATGATNYYQTSRYTLCAERLREAALIAGW